VVVSHPEQGWSLLCNGIVLFDDTGALLPDGQSIPPRRLAGPRVPARPLTLSGPVAAYRAGGELTWPRFVPASGRRVSR
jgi:hypothetical protein